MSAIDASYSEEVQLHAKHLTTVSHHLNLPEGYSTIVTVGRKVAPTVLALADIQGRERKIRLECTHVNDDSTLDFRALEDDSRVTEAYQNKRIGAFVLGEEACAVIAHPNYLNLVPLVFGIRNSLPPPQGNNQGGMLFACAMHCGPEGSAEQKRIRTAIEQVFEDGFQMLETGETPFEKYFVARRTE